MTIKSSSETLWHYCDKLLVKYSNIYNVGKFLTMVVSNVIKYYYSFDTLAKQFWNQCYKVAFVTLTWQIYKCSTALFTIVKS